MKAFFGMILIGIILFLMNGCTSCSSKPAASSAPAQKSLYEQDGVLLIDRKAYYTLIRRGATPESAKRDAPWLRAQCEQAGGGQKCYSN